MSENKTVMAEDKSVNKNNRKKTRKFLYQKIYASTFCKVDENFDETFYNDVFKFDLDKKYLDEMFSLILEKEGYLLKIISMLAPKFKIESM